MKKSLVASFFAFIGVFAFADTWVWTGAKDAYWTNAANWTVNGAVATVPPGRYKIAVLNGDTGDFTSQTVGALDSIAEFPALPEGRPTTIDVDGVWDVLKIVVKSGAPKYTFGTSDKQEFCIYPTGGRFIVEEGANGADVIACFGCGSDSNYVNAMGSVNTPRVENWSSSEIDFKKFFLYRISGWYEYQIAFYGTGNIRISGLSRYQVCQGFDLFQTGGAKVIIACDVPSVSRSFIRRIRNANGYTSEIEILKDCVLCGYPGMGPFDLSGTLKVTGEGEFKCLTTLKTDGKGLGEREPQNNTQFIYQKIEFHCKMTSELANNFYGSWYHAYGSGTTEFLGENLLEGPIQMAPAETASPTLRAATIGADGVASSIGKAPLHLGNSARLLYTGAGETCTRTLCLTNRSSKLSNGNAVQIPAIGIVEQGGTGKLTFSSPVKCACVKTEGTTSVTNGPLEEATLILANSSAQEFEATTAFADDGGTKLNLVKRGTGALTLSGASTYKGTTTLEGGMLALTAGSSIAASSGLMVKGGVLAVSGTSALPPLTVSAGVNTLTVADGATLTLNGLAVTAGTLNIVTTGSAAVQMTGATAATTLPTGVTLNGNAAEFDANGKLVRRTYSPSEEIPARGGRIPNAPGEVVGITTAGEPDAGPITLADSLTTAKVGTLYQRTDTAAMVDLAAGQILKADVVARHADAAALTIGSAAGQGTLQPADTEIQFDNASTNEPITVNAALVAPSASAKMVNSGDGTVRFTAPFAWNGDVAVNAGTVVAANPEQTTLSAKLSGAGEFRKEGAGDWSLSVSQANFAGTFTIAGGTATPAAGDARVFGSLDQGATVVTNGGQLVINKSCATLQNHTRELRLSGFGPDGDGALKCVANFYAPLRLTLDGDTGITNASTMYFDKTVLDMNGHDLRWCNPNHSISLTSVVVTNAGRWIVEPWFASNNQWAQFSLNENCHLGEADDPPIMATNGTRFTVSSTQTEKPRRRLVITADASQLGPEASFTGGHSYAVDGSNTNGAGWAGPIEVVNANTWLSLNQWDSDNANQYFTITGPISGQGGVNFGYNAKSGTKGHAILANPHNTYTGPTKVGANSGGSLSFLYPGSMPDWSKLYLTGGRVGIFWGEGLWDKASYLAAANASYAYLGYSTESSAIYLPSVIAINTTYAENREAEIKLEDADITGANFSIGHDGEGVLRVTGPFTKPVRFGVYRGSLVFTGPDTITLGAGVVSSDWRLNEGNCRIENAADVHLAMGCVIVGGSSTSFTEASGKLSIVDSKVTKDQTNDSTYWQAANYDSVMPGLYGRGVVEVSGDSVVTGRFIVGTSTTGRGALRVKGGRVTDLAVGRGSYVGIFGGSGAIEVSGGVYDVAGLQYLGSGTTTVNGEIFGGWATFTQTGGSTIIHPSGLLDETYTGTWSLGSGEKSRVAVYIAGGSVTNERDTSFCGGLNSKAVFTMAGGEFYNTRPANPGRCSTGDSMTIINLNGGVFASMDVGKCNKDTETSHAGAYVNFNGGTYRCTVSSQLVFGNLNDSTWNARVDRVTVYEGGAVIDTPVDNVVAVPLSKPTGNGVASVPFTDPGDTFVGSPFVDIVGDGTGASAYAHFDAASGRVTSIEITSPGCDYTWAKSIIRYGTKVWTNDCVLAANGAGGGFTKKGARKLTFAVPNTYTGDTVVEEGTLELGCEGAINENSKIVLKGGSITTSDGVALPPFALRLKVGETLTPAALTLAEGSTV